uniref:SEL1L2 adaptor subunit of SYVN1 ubiquitin ligase n=1 Tax=Macaca nemestrina TaxID=9545 RepID=A0A2K6E8X0_MACNE
MADEVKLQSPIRLTFEALVVQSIRAEKHNKRQKERNVTTQVSANEIKQYLPHILEQRTSSNVINKRENLLEKKKNQRKIRIKGIQNKDILRNKNHLQKQAEKNFTDEGDQLFKMGIKVLQQSKTYLLFAKAADMGNLKAMEKMADALLFGNFGMQNITAAIQLYESLAKEGSCKAQNALGFLSSYGIGMEYDQAKALIYYTFGSAGGSIMSQMILGYRYLSGINVLQNCEVALSYYKKVADHIADTFEKSEGVPVEKVRLTERPENLSSNSEILDWDIYQYYKFLAERGDVQIQVMYTDEIEFLEHENYKAGSGIWKDYKLAFKYFYLASQSGQPLAIYYLAEMYATGTGVVRSCRTAVELYKGVCELGHWAEKFLTAYFAYKDGDIDSSLVQYALLAEMGYEVAQSNSAFILESKKANILEKEKMYPMALLLWNRAAIQGNAFARVKIGDYHYYGYGTKKDYQTAATHYSIAADKYHNAQAMFNLAYMYEHGLGIAKDIHLARRLYDMAAQTSPDAYIPVFFALMKLETMHLLRDILFFNFTMRWNWLKLDNTVGPHWDLFVIGLIVAGLILLLRNHRG